MQLLLFNEESLVSASHQLALITSLPFVHTARRYYRLNGSVRRSDWPREVGNYHSRAGKFSKLGHLEEVKVVTRSPLVNQRRDHYRVYNSQTLCEPYHSLLRRDRPGASARPEPGARRGTRNSCFISGIISECHKQIN